MAAIANEIDRILQAAATRQYNPSNAAVLLAASTAAFHVATGGSFDPATITFTASLIAIEGTIVFSCTGGTLSTSGNVATLTYANMSGSTAIITAAVTANGATVTSNTCFVSKVLDGAAGTNGANGTNGTNGSNGARGAGQYYATGSSWVDATADAATPGSNALDDLVTISDGSTFVNSKRWNGSAWVAIGTVVDGALVVTGSITAAKINSNGLSIRKSDGTLILDAGGLATGFEAPGTLNSALTISAGGTLSGGGGGTVTIGGLGYTGDLAATSGAPAGTLVNGVAAATVSAGAADGATALAAVNHSTTGLAQRMRLNADNILGGIQTANAVSAPAGFRAGNVLWNAAGAWVSGSGVAMTPTGLVGYNSSGVAQFSINASTGAAVFAGALSAATGTFGSVTIATGGSLSSGQTAYNTGTGIWFGLVSGTLKLSAGVAGGAGFTWDGSTFTIKDAVTVRTTPFAVNNIVDGTYSFAHSTTERFLGTYTASSVGGSGTVTFNWTLDQSGANGGGMTARLGSSPTGTTMSIYGKCNVVANLDIYLTVTAVDGTGASAVPETFLINTDFT